MADFTPGELQVMRVLWEHGPLSPIEIQDRFPRPIRNATLRSALVVLLEKGHVSREKVGRSYVYRACTPKVTTFRKMTRSLIDVFCGGSPATLIAQLIKNEKLSEDDILELRRLANHRIEQETTSKTSKKAPRRKAQP